MTLWRSFRAGMMIPGSRETMTVFGDMEQDVAGMLDSNRYEHCLRTARLCQRLASLHGVDEGRAYVAGLLHDCGKGQSLDLLYEEDADELESLDEMVRRTPALHHSFIGAFFARTRFGVTDSDTLTGISFHPTGSPEFGPIGRLLYLSDYLEPGREFRDRARLEALALRDPHAALLEVTVSRMEHLKSKGQTVHPRTNAFYRSLKEEAAVRLDRPIEGVER